MNAFKFINNELHAEEVPISKISESVGTPFYCYSTACIIDRYTEFHKVFNSSKVKILYSVKANSNLSIIKTFAKLGAGIDAVSEGEIRKAIAGGISPENIVFSGVGKTYEELLYALEVGIHQFNIESEEELYCLNDIAIAQNMKAPIAIRINPNTDAKSHDKITTGRLKDKFGIPITEAKNIFNKASQLKGIKITGIAIHIGSQILSLNPFIDAFRKISSLVMELKEDGYDITNLDLGGGLGIKYGSEIPPLTSEYAEVVLRETSKTNCNIFLEPGRSLIGESGVLITKIIYKKIVDGQDMLIVDSGMNDLIRPAMYNAFHEFIPVNQILNPVIKTVDIVGPVCESGDTFIRNLQFPDISSGKLLAIKTAGAYGSVLSSTYNSRPLIPEVLVNKNEYSVIRPRQTYEELFANDQIAPWLS